MQRWWWLMSDAVMMVADEWWWLMRDAAMTLVADQ